MKNEKQTKTDTFTTNNSSKQQFIEAVELMVPGNRFIAEAARHVPQEILPAIAGIAALEFASTLELLCKSWRLRQPLKAVRTSSKCSAAPKAAPLRSKLNSKL